MGNYNGIAMDANKTEYVDVHVDEVKDFEDALDEIVSSNAKRVIFSGRDPLRSENLVPLIRMLCPIKRRSPSKEVWLNTWYKWEDVLSEEDKDMSAARLAAVYLSDIFYERRAKRCIDIAKSLDAHETVIRKKAAKKG